MSLEESELHRDARRSPFEECEHLHHAARAGDYDKCLDLLNRRLFKINDLKKSLVHHGAERIDDTEVTPLMLACAYDHTRIGQLLIDRGADIHMSNCDGYTALHFAVCNSRHSAILLCLTNKANVNHLSTEPTRFGPSTPLMVAASVLGTEYCCTVHQPSEWTSASVKREGESASASNDEEPWEQPNLPRMCMQLLLFAGADPSLTHAGHSALCYAKCPRFLDNIENWRCLVTEETDFEHRGHLCMGRFGYSRSGYVGTPGRRRHRGRLWDVIQQFLQRTGVKSPDQGKALLLRPERRRRFHLFALGVHERVGKESPVRLLHRDSDAMRIIYEYLIEQDLFRKKEGKQEEEEEEE